MFDLDNIFSVLDEINASHGQLYPVIDLKNSTILKTNLYCDASPLQDVGQFFLNVIRENKLSTVEIKFFQRTFTTITAHKDIERMIGIADRMLPNFGITPANDEEYQKLLREKSEGEKINNVLKKLLSEVSEQEKRASRTLDLLFPKNKKFILDKLTLDASAAKGCLVCNVRRMSKVGLKRVNQLISSIVINENHTREVWKSAGYRKLKQRMLGGVRFNSKAKRVTYTVFESPRETREKTVTQEESEKTKTRTNVPSMTGVHVLQHPTIESLSKGAYPLNIPSFTSALMDGLKKTLSTLTTETRLTNGDITAYNKHFVNKDISESELVTEGEKIIDYTTKLMEEANSVYRFIEENKKTLREAFDKCYMYNAQIAELNKNSLQEVKTGCMDYQFFVHMNEFPGVSEKSDLASIEEVIRKTLFEIAEIIRDKQEMTKVAKLVFQHKVSGELLEKKYDLDQLKIECIETALNYYLNVQPDSSALFERLINHFEEDPSKNAPARTQEITNRG